MPFDQSKWLWMNGDVQPWDAATVHVSAHTLHYGSGVFEGMRCYQTPKGPAVFRLTEHLDRFYASAAIYQIPIPYTRAELQDAVHEVIRQNGFESCYIRPICFYGSSVLSVHPRSCPVQVVIMAWPWGSYLGDVEAGVRVTVSKWTRFHSSMMPTVAKACGQYVNSMLANTEAASRGFDEAIMLDSEGYIAEGAGENLFLVRDGRIITNDQDSSILMGITRDAVLEIARDRGYEVRISRFKVDDLVAADEAFFTGTAAEVTPIHEVDGQVIGKGGQGPVTRAIRESFFAITAGEAPRYEAWLSYTTKASAAVPMGANPASLQAVPS
ncbi:MAG TPA: branched-chain amino acid transaminase [Blastocatellia bacterium]|nr:branched-chain amino acid transaminase [Blastocatellia bacterium]